jgi:hypothetical protein
MERTEGFQELKPSFFYYGFWVKAPLLGKEVGGSRFG